MVLQLASEVVWSSLKQELFAVLGMVTEKGEARTVGVVYIVHEHRLYVVTGKDTWKARHMTQNAHVSVTVPIAKRIPFLFWIKIPRGDDHLFRSGNCAKCRICEQGCLEVAAAPRIRVT
ncbi:MAG: pyridoxamine 5'-phosphate oxidase family protein [Chloroflexi bacterium]|uniref:pyridoxamine 5'-phosphate oxidase family protein n=1 Tax=Candidatus Flexifilum breve TaxID=3140694 RepID=UPI0031354F90|nr:pyridoxamine 5'-phosphate oxidase family protein [Chloroflexota bacterium]